MNELATIALAVLSTLGGGGLIAGLIAWRKYGPEIRQLKADTRRTVAEAVAVEQSAEDEHWQALIKAHTEYLLQPLTAKVDEQGQKIADLERAVKSITRRYHAALDTLRSYVRYTAVLAGLLNEAGISAPPPPVIPAEINDDY